MAPTPRISVAEASEKLAQGWIYVDVRTVEEFDAGRPPGATNVPFALAGAGGRRPNIDFVPVMSALFPKDAKLIVGCQSGGRSARAAAALEEAGFTQILELRPGWDGVRDPFGQLTEPGWSRASLPVEQGPAEGRSWADVRDRAE